MDGQTIPVDRDGLVNRRTKLEQALASVPNDPQVPRLLQEVDAALERMDTGAYGICETCEEPIEEERCLTADPLIRFCIDCLPP
jgi:RNA polymerase-binding transcription factor DksA